MSNNEFWFAMLVVFLIVYILFVERSPEIREREKREKEGRQRKRIEEMERLETIRRLQEAVGESKERRMKASGSS